MRRLLTTVLGTFLLALIVGCAESNKVDIPSKPVPKPDKAVLDGPGGAGNGQQMKTPSPPPRF
jgi:hypothetical protein